MQSIRPHSHKHARTENASTNLTKKKKTADRHFGRWEKKWATDPFACAFVCTWSVVLMLLQQYQKYTKLKLEARILCFFYHPPKPFSSIGFWIETDKKRCMYIREYCRHHVSFVHIFFRMFHCCFCYFFSAAAFAFKFKMNVKKNVS